jgi:plasmid stabilization system protein ParE
MHKQTRKAVLRKFPYSIFYLVEGDAIIVLACFHGKRNPIDWLRRAD